jgi:hypothetical protein
LEAAHAGGATRPGAGAGGEVGNGDGAMGADGGAEGGFADAVAMANHRIRRRPFGGSLRVGQRGEGGGGRKKHRGGGKLC